MKIELIQAIQSLVPTAQVVVIGTELSGIQWLEQNTAERPTNEAILAEVDRLQKEYDALEYQINRAKEYPSIADQLDDLFHNGIDGWRETIANVKAKYPKEVINE
jgi:phosphoglycolate phosphatase-like HAD superfamily hydrolase